MAVNSYREDEFMENTDKKKIMRRLFSYLLAYKGTIIAVLVCMGITVAISLVNPLLIEEANRSLYCTVRSAWADWAWNFCTRVKPDLYCDGKTQNVCNGGDLQQNFASDPPGSL